MRQAFNKLISSGDAQDIFRCVGILKFDQMPRNANFTPDVYTRYKLTSWMISNRVLQWTTDEICHWRLQVSCHDLAFRVQISWSSLILFCALESSCFQVISPHLRITAYTEQDSCHPALVLLPAFLCPTLACGMWQSCWTSDPHNIQASLM